MTKKLFYILVLSQIFTVGCRQPETPKNAPATPKDAIKTAAIRVSAPETDAAEPAMTADADGNLYVLYVAHGAEKSADIYLQKFDSQKNPLGEKVRVNPNAGEATAWRGDPPTIVTSADKTVYVGWTRSVKTATESGRDVCLSVSRDGGKTFAAPIKVNDDIKPVSHGMHSLAVGKDGKIFMAWLDERNVKSERHAENLQSDSNDAEFQFVKVHHNSNQTEQPKKDEEHEASEPNSEVFFAVSSDGGKTFAPNLKLSGEVCPCCKTALAVAPDGRIYASWRQVVGDNFRHIAVASSVDAGKKFSSPAIVSDDRWKINACPVSGAALTIAKDNQLKIAWFTAGEAGKIGLYAAVSDDFGATFSERILVSEGEVAGTPIFLPDKDESVKLLWEAEGKIYQLDLAANLNFSRTEIVSVGMLPSAATVGGKKFVVYIGKENEKRGVWLADF